MANQHISAPRTFDALHWRGPRGDGQVTLQHTGKSTYGCFRQDLTGFGGISLSRTQPPPPDPREENTPP